MKLKHYSILICGSLSMALYVSSIDFKYPKYFPSIEYNTANNTPSAEKVKLGRALFYDPILSKDKTISCASCHSPYNAFAHTDHDLSHGINDQIGTRNAPALFNLAWQKSFMWDGAINHLDMQALFPITHPKEMGETIEKVLDKLRNSNIYPKLFLNAFKDSIIETEKLLKALSLFQLTLISSNSKYDKVQKGLEQFSVQEKKGHALFLKNCNSCHTEPLFSNYNFANNGLPMDSTLNDYGRWGITHQSKDSLLFTSPYMHDGRFKTLNQVLNHYIKGIEKSETLSKDLKSNILLTSNERADIIAFLLTLNDKDFIFDHKHQFPRDLLLKPED
ncbi:MAG TPA: cytochrome-c peroxidase [Flavobacteriales bacterium]|nr:cytochrome-c peroxidase [Flavobacteriales bacterium]